MSQSSKTTTASLPTSVPTVMFNFTASQSNRLRQARLAVRATAAVFTLAVVTFAVLGFVATRAQDAASSQIDAARTTREAAESRLNQLTGGAGNLPAHLDARRDELAAAVGTDSDVGPLVAQVLASAPAGVRVLSVALGTPFLPLEGSTDTNANKTRQVRIVATAPDFDAPITWRNTLSTLGFLTDVRVTPTSAEGSVAISVTANLTPTSFTQRLTALAEQVGPLTAPPATPAADAWEGS